MLARGALKRLRSRACLKTCPQSCSHGAPLSVSSQSRSYDDTIPNLKVTNDTRVLVQGITGKQATFDSQQTLDYDTKIVGGVRPGKEGEHLGLPYFPSVKAAKDNLKPDATLVYVAAPHAAGAIEEAIEAEVPLIVAVAEHIPLHDMLRVQAMLRSQSRSRLVGANSPGMTSTHAKCRLGFQPLPFFKQGSISIVAKSGTLSYETVASTTKAGLGQSYVIGMGGDSLPGTDFVDALKIFEQDENTEGIIMVGEVGGFAEEKAADWIKDYRSRVANPKPIMALIGGLQAVPGRVMGHDGAFAAPGEGDSQSKVRALVNAGVVMTDHPAKFGEAMKSLLGQPPRSSSSSFNPNQRRSIHTLRRRPYKSYASSSPRTLKRHLTLSPSQGLDYLKQNSIPVASIPAHSSSELVVTFGIDRSFYQPRLHIRRTPNNRTPTGLASAKVLYQLGSTPEAFNSAISPAVSQLTASDTDTKSLSKILQSLAQIWREKEGSWFRVEIGQVNGSLGIVGADLSFDDWAFAMSKRQKDVHELRDVSREVAEEVEVEKDGIVYVRLPGDGKVGTLVNGAGLAMNTTDALALAGHPAANFLDTGGKATAETVRSSFRAVLSDSRVKAVFVNIFGGLTRCEMIAEGIILAYKKEGIKVPVVVRLRGTNEEEGRRVLRDSGLNLVAVEDFQEGVRRIGEAIGA